MIPALFAKIDRPDLTVMDMCAAPGMIIILVAELIGSCCD